MEPNAWNVKYEKTEDVPPSLLPSLPFFLYKMIIVRNGAYLSTKVTILHYTT
jgi:hypothetical protein